MQKCKEVLNRILDQIKRGQDVVGNSIVGQVNKAANPRAERNLFLGAVMFKYFNDSET